MDLPLSQTDLLHYLATHMVLAVMHFALGMVSIRYAAKRGWFSYWDLPTPTMKQTIGMMLLVSVLL